MIYKLRKKYQREVNKDIRIINKQINDDRLFLGRFYVRQIKNLWGKISDGSGEGISLITIRIIDKKTNYYKDYLINYNPWNPFYVWDLNMRINEFIVESSGFYNETPRNSIFNAVDYRNVKVNEQLFNLKENDFNFYKEYEGGSVSDEYDIGESN